jgi:adenine-specific DNA-methyltransferase
VEEFHLEPWAHPMFGRSEHVQGLIYSAADHQSNQDQGLPAYFLWFQEMRMEDLAPAARAYVESGLAQQLHTRFKCRVRKPWFKVPSVYVAPVAMLKRAHHYCRLILNSAAAYSTDTAYRIRLKQGTAEELVCGFVNSLTCLTAELEGRHYGGGVLELVPSEIEKLLLPKVDGLGAALAATDERFRADKNSVAFVQEQDAIVLSKLGLTSGERELLFEAWSKLRDRRQRVPEEPPKS